MTDTSPTATFEAFRLSPQQRYVWIAQRGGLPYRAQCVVRMQGALRAEALEAALRRVVERHEILHTLFPHVQGMKIPVQAIMDVRPLWNSADLSAQDAAEQAASVESLIAEECCRPLDFEKGALVQALLLRLSPSDHMLALTLPTLCADAWSLRLIVCDLIRAYSGTVTEEDEPMQYLQFSEWQNEVLESDDELRDAGRAHWKKTLTDLPQPAKLPFETEPANESPATFHALAEELDSAVWSRLRTWSDREDAAPSTVLAACWHTLIGILGEQADSLYWFTVDGRKFEELNDSVGLFAATVPIRSPFEADAGFRKAVRRMSDALQEAVDLQYDWGAVADAASDAADMGFGFSFEEEQSLEAASDLRVSLAQAMCCLKPFKLQLVCLQCPEGLSLELRYDARRYRQQDIQRLIGYFRTLLQNALERPEVPLGSLSLLPPAERAQVLKEWNNTYTEFPPVGAIHYLFEQAAQGSPQAIALVCQDQQLTYQELNTRANRLAHYLQMQGVQPDTPVGLFLPRSLDLIVGMLAILKAGGAYLPLDPALPQERLEGMLQDSQARLLLTHAGLPSLDVADLNRICLDQDAATIGQKSADNPASAVELHHLAYVIYTSGSTGRPKGVGIEHRQLLNYVQGVTARLELPAGASYASVSTLAADLGNTMVFPALCLGGSLHLLASDTAMDVGAWREYLKKHPIDCLKIVPSHLSALLGGGDVEASLLPHQVLVLGGETSHWELVERVKRAAPSLRVYNHYGPTETTVGVLTYAMGEKRGMEAVGSATVPLGRPLPNCQVYVLNGAREPVPVGVLGELYIGGAQVGRGYLNRPELTQERFVEDPFHPMAGVRMYRTGDVCRYLADGSIEFVGRVDHQV
ncbi:MAG TPA: amino acid adenylation domain-containing protein, partial [Chthonomonadaceae bacterium]|nr:amino acid adenylation domain-containing protein [Chthonomonadaceae bacterium]